MSTPHPSAETVSELLEGLLSPDETAAVEQHLAGCPDCRDVRAALADVRTLLGELPEPRLPADVVDRLEVAATATATDESGEPPAHAATPAASSLDAARARRRRRLLAAAGAVAACAALLVGTGAALQQLGGTSDSGEDATAAQGAAPDNRAAAEKAPGSADASALSLDRSEYLTASGRDYQSATLPTRVRALVADGRAFAPVDPGRLEQGRLADRRALASCLAGLSPGAARPLAVDLARYEGTPAAVVVLPVPGHSDRVDAWVVAPGCSARDPQVRDRVRVPRP